MLKGKLLSACRSEGLPKRDMESLGVMGRGLTVAENSSVSPPSVGVGVLAP